MSPMKWFFLSLTMEMITAQICMMLFSGTLIYTPFLLIPKISVKKISWKW